MKLVAFSIVLDGEPFIERHLPIFQKTNLDWKWIVVHGSAQNNGSTSWCKPQEPRLSRDGTTEYLKSIKMNGTGTVIVVEDERWESKDQMVNTALNFIKEPCVLMEIDSDEIWSPPQLERIVEIFSFDPILQLMKFACRYFVGPNLITVGKHCYGDMDYEWNRAWKFVPGSRFKSHEPPILDTPVTYFADKDTTRAEGLVFDHFAYATEAQVAYKEKFYGYDGAVNGWRALQKHFENPDAQPVSLSRFFPWVKGDEPKVVRLRA